jgi:hypothetical protein
VLIALSAVGLSACGHSTEGVEPVSTTGPTHGVVVEVGASNYSVSDMIAVTVRNELVNEIIATDHQTSCTIVQLQIEANGAWQNQGGCALGMATRMIRLAAGSSTAVQVAPGKGQMTAKPWPAGTYRVSFTYHTGSPIAPGSSVTVVSAPFTVS